MKHCSSFTNVLLFLGVYFICFAEILHLSFFPGVREFIITITKYNHNHRVKHVYHNGLSSLFQHVPLNEPKSV